MLTVVISLQVEEKEVNEKRKLRKKEPFSWTGFWGARHLDKRPQPQAIAQLPPDALQYESP